MRQTPQIQFRASHGCFSGASTETLKYFFGSDRIEFSIDSNVAGLLCPVRTYALNRAAKENEATAGLGRSRHRNTARKTLTLARKQYRVSTVSKQL